MRIIEASLLFKYIFGDSVCSRWQKHVFNMYLKMEVCLDGETVAVTSALHNEDVISIRS